MTQKTKQTRNIVRLFIFLGAILFAMAPNFAGAEVVEFQVQGSSISQLVGESIIAEGICPTKVDIFGEKYIDRVEINTDGAFGVQRNGDFPLTVAINPDISLSTDAPQLTIPLTVYTKTLSCAATVGCDEEATMDVTALVNLFMDGNQLCGEFAGIEVLGVLWDLDIGDFVAPQCMDIDLSMIDSMLGDAVVIGTGVTVSADDRVAVRIEYGAELSDGTPDYASADDVAWGNFLGGALAPNDHPDDGWSLFIDHQLLTAPMIVQIEDKLDDEEDFILTGSSSASWPANPDRARMEITSHGESDTCSIGLTVHTGINLFLGDDSYLPEGMAAPDAIMVAEGNLTVDKDTGDVILCAFGFSFLGVIAYPEFFSVWGVISGIIRGIDPDSPDMDDDELCENVGESGFRCITPINFPTFGLSDDPSYPHAELGIERLYGHEQGLILSGDFIFHSAAPIELITETHEPLVLDTGGHCCSERVAFRGILSVSGSGRVCETPEFLSPVIPDGVTDPETAPADTLNVYRISRTSSGSGDMANFLVELYAGEGSSFWSSPYDVLVRVKSTVGIGVYRIRAPRDPDSETWESTYFECSMKRFDCELAGMLIYDGPEFNLPPDETCIIDKIDEEELTMIKDIETDAEVESKVIVSTDTEKTTTTIVKDTDVALSTVKVVSSDTVTSSVEESTDTSPTKTTKDVESDDRIAADTSADSASSTASSYVDTSVDTKITVSTATK